MTKDIIVVCQPSQIDPPLRRSLAHLVNSCDISIVHNGHDFFDEISSRPFDLIVIDFEVPGIDSLELVESIHYIDPGVPVILMLHKAHQAITETARQLSAHPIVRPFKPLKFLRLVDRLLHQHLTHYRQLVDTLITILDSLRAQTAAACAFLVEDNGQILVSSGEVAGLSPGVLGSIAVAGVAENGNIDHKAWDEALGGVACCYGVYVTTVTESLYLALVVAEDAPAESADTWLPVIAAADRTRAVLNDQLVEGELPLAGSHHPRPRIFIPLAPAKDRAAAAPPDEEPAVNWEIIANTSNVLSRMDKFCRLD